MENQVEEVFDVTTFSVVKIQSLVRRFLTRLKVLTDTFQRYEKIWDPKRKKFYYYDKLKDKSSWIKPVLLLKHDLFDIAPTYLPEQAIKKVQSYLRKFSALKRVRLLYQATIEITIDEETGKRTYYNPRSGRSANKLPAFMKGRLDYRKYPKKKRPKKPDSSSESDSEDSEAGLDAEARRQRRRLRRKYPRLAPVYFASFVLVCLLFCRSKLQRVIDKAEDNIQVTVDLNLSTFGTDRFSSRVYELTELKSLILANNKLTRISSKIQTLHK
jgi:hypothetical protein